MTLTPSQRAILREAVFAPLGEAVFAPLGGESKRRRHQARWHAKKADYDATYGPGNHTILLINF